MSDKNQQIPLFETATESKTAGPVECLGMTFENDEARRAHFTELLRQKLNDPEFRKIEGFPIGEDEDILALSDPPYYTACPNPWLADFVAEWEAQKPPKLEGYEYQREPFAADVSEGKNDPIYTAHSYHTKVPHKAVMRYILHYTEPGDIIFDGFCGTGMTGVAAQLCGDRKVVESLGYRVETNGTILQAETHENGKKRWVPFSRLGVRRAVLNDLSPAATFIAYNYNAPVDADAFEKEAKRILDEVENECSWMFETRHTDGRIGKINYTVWSDVFVCPECAGEVIFWEAAVDKAEGKVFNEFPCPQCSANLTKRIMERAWVTKYDVALNQTIQQFKQVPVLINYKIGKKRTNKIPDSYDLELLEKIEGYEIPYWFPTGRMIEGQETRRNDPMGVTHVHHFYTRRNLSSFSSFFSKCPSWLRWIVTGSIQRGSKQHQIAITRIGGSKAKEGGATAGHRRGTLYIPSNQVEMNALVLMTNRIRSIKRAIYPGKRKSIALSTFSTTEVLPQLENTFDYFFFDPPFGANIAYSELNFIQEDWIGVKTHQDQEAIVDRSQDKSLRDYQALIEQCFKAAYLMLKPGRWMTVEFSNTNASVWNVIQTTLQEAGFLVANVSYLDKKRGGLNAIVGNTAVKQDLAISAYKPNGGFSERFQYEVNSEEGVWDFVRTHLSYLPVVKRQNGSIQIVPERDPRILFDQMIAYYVRKGYPVPLSSQEFQLGLVQRFPERDGMVFLPEQVAEYDKKRLAANQIVQISLFVDDESSAIQWLRQLLLKKPQAFADINPQFMQQLSGWRKNEEPLDLRELLQQNFLSYDGDGPVPEQIHAYLSSNWRDMRKLAKNDPALVAKAKDRWYVPDPNKQADLDKMRQRSLLREFETYKESKQRRLKLFRLEAVRAGFQKAWQENDYDTILAVARKIPPKILQEDPKLLMWYDMSLTRTGQTE